MDPPFLTTGCSGRFANVEIVLARMLNQLFNRYIVYLEAEGG